MRGRQDIEDVNEESVTYFVRVTSKEKSTRWQSRYMRDWPANHVNQEYRRYQADFPSDEYDVELVEIRKTLSRKTLSSEEIEKLFAPEK